MAQEAISYLIIEKAREGKIVARLKVGDPFIFDRGGEEALFLHQHGLPMEVVPGVPITIAVPAYAGIPVTYPGGGDALTIIRGYDETRTAMPDVDWRALAALEGTLICYAGPQQFPRIIEALVANGRHSDTPAAIVENGTLPTQTSLVGTLHELTVILDREPRQHPGLLVVGRVVAFREHLRWFDRRPLFGKRILITRPKQQARDFVDRVTALGAEAIEAPMIRITPADDPAPLADAVDRAGEFDWIVFTSANAVEAFMGVLLAGDRDVRALKGPRLCAVGTATAEALSAHGIKVELVPSEFRAEAAAEAIVKHGRIKGAKVLLPRADIGRDALGQALRAAGADVTEVVAYRTIVDEGQREDDPDIYKMLLERRIDVVTFTSGSAVRNFARVYGAEQAADLLRNIPVAAIGPVTADAATAAGFHVTIQPATYTIAALVDAVVDHFKPSA